MRFQNTVLGFGLALLIGSTGAWAAKPAPPPPPPSGAACAGSDGVFPAMAYQRDVYKGSTYQKTQIFLANSEGNCEVLVYDTQGSVGIGRVRFHFNENDGSAKLAWSQSYELSGRQRVSLNAIRVANFSVVDRTVQGVLPMTSTDSRVKKVWTAPSQSNVGISDVGLSRDGHRLAFSTGSGSLNITGSVTREVRICSLNVVANEPSGCGMPETPFTRSSTSASTQTGGTFHLSIGRNYEDSAERVYFVYRPDASWSHGDIVYVQKLLSGGWQSPVVVIDRSLHYPDDPNPGVNFPDVLSIDGAPDRLAFYHDADASTHTDPSIDVLDTGIEGDGALMRDVGVGYRPSWTLNPSLDAAPNVLVDSARIYGGATSSPVGEIDVYDNFSPVTLGVTGYFVDSAY